MENINYNAMAIKKLPHNGFIQSFQERKEVLFLERAGFTLIEIMIVIAIIATLAAISIPAFLTSRINANETSAIASCKIISSACQSYYMIIEPKIYPSQLDDLVPPASDPPYLDTVLAVDKRKQGYRFEYVLNNSENFNLFADPITVGRTGNRYFFVDETGVIRAKAGGRPNAADPSIQ